MNYDIIGDIHGYAEQLKALLSKLGYSETMGAWRHPERMAVFVGDFIDRGPQQVETVMLVRRMVEAETALAIMGNHEFNAIAWFLPDPWHPGESLRPHFSLKWGDKNRRQHAAFLAEVAAKPQLHKEIIEWFLTLPLWLDLSELRVVHACWHQPFMDYLAPMLVAGNRLNKELMLEAAREPATESEKDDPEPSTFKAADALIKGIEVPLPLGHHYLDKDNITRTRVRVRWWDTNARTYRSAAMLPPNGQELLPDQPMPEHKLVTYHGTKPLFVGHYWLTGNPAPLSDKVACVDYSAAKNGKLCAYRWHGEAILHSSSFQWV